MTNLTDVLFLQHTDDPEVYAAFPNEKWDNRDYTSYAHFGQHSPVCPEYVSQSTVVTPERYNDLKAELEAIGYQLRVLNQVPECFE